MTSKRSFIALITPVFIGQKTFGRACLCTRLAKWTQSRQFLCFKPGRRNHDLGGFARVAAFNQRRHAAYTLILTDACMSFSKGGTGASPMYRRTCSCAP